MYLLFFIIFFILVAIFVWYVSLKEKIKYYALDNEKNKFKCYYDLMCQWVRNDNEQWNICNWLKQKGIVKVAIYGEGPIGRCIYHTLKGSDEKILYFIDKNAGRIIDDLAPVINLENINSFDMPDAVIVSLAYNYNEIQCDLNKAFGKNVKVYSIEEIVYRM